MSAQLALEILSLSAGLSQFSNFQIVNLGQQNNLVAIAPELVQFISTCGVCDNQLATLFTSNLNLDGLSLNLGQCNDCLQQLVDLQGLFVSGLDLGNNKGNANETDNANEDQNENKDDNQDGNQDENLNEEEQAKADEEAAAKKAEEEAAAKAAEEAAKAGAGNETANANETAVADGQAEGGAANLTEIEDPAADPAADEGDAANENEDDAAAEKDANKEDGDDEKRGRRNRDDKKIKMKRDGVVVQRSAAGKRVVGAGKVKVLGSVGFAAVMGVLVWGL